MHLDIFTLIVQLATVCLLLGTGFLFAWFRMRREPTLLWWSLSFYVRAPGLLLYLLRDGIHDRLSIDLANVFILLGLSFTWAGARKFSQHPVHAWAVLAPAAVWLLACQIPPVYADIGNRIAVLSGLSAIYSLAIAYEFCRDCAYSPMLRKLLVLLFAANGLIQVARTAYVLLVPMPGGIMQADGWVAGSFIVPFVVIITGALIVSCMYRERTILSLQSKAERDPLTDALNKGAFGESARRAVEVGRAGDGFTSLILLDLDHFKAINDTHGHQAGDVVLVRFARMVRAVLPKSGLFGRIGGEEFAVLLPACPLGEARRFAEMLRRATEGLTVRHAGKAIPLTVSIGVSGTQVGETGFHELMAQADRALYEAKHAGRNRVVVRLPGETANAEPPPAPSAVLAEAPSGALS